MGHRHRGHRAAVTVLDAADGRARHSGVPGQGLDLPRIQDKARAGGLIAEGQSPSDGELAELQALPADPSVAEFDALQENPAGWIGVVATLAALGRCGTVALGLSLPPCSRVGPGRYAGGNNRALPRVCLKWTPRPPFAASCWTS